MDLPSRGGRAPGSQANGSFPKGTGRHPEKSPAGYPPAHHRDSTPRERGRLARMLSLGLPLSFPAMRQPAPPAGGNRMGPAEAEAGRRCRLIPVEEMAEAAGGFVRAGRPRSRVGFKHAPPKFLFTAGTPALPGGLPPMTGSHQGGKIAGAFRGRLWLKEVHRSSCPFVVRLHFQNDNARLFLLCMIRTAGAGLARRRV